MRALFKIKSGGKALERRLTVALAHTQLAVSCRAVTGIAWPAALTIRDEIEKHDVLMQ